jgi:transposase InsO family protein
MPNAGCEQPRAEVTDRMLIAGPRHLHAILDEYAVHYNEHRPHRARNLRPPGAVEAFWPSSPIPRRRRYGVAGPLAG